jgi:phosphoglycerol transferase MdoB-like AlkP superfamily enzyme
LAGGVFIGVKLMNLDYIYSYVHSFLMAHQWVAAILIIALALFAWRMTWLFLKCVFGIFVLVAVVYVFSYLTDSASVGSMKKHEITTERESRLDQ